MTLADIKKKVNMVLAMAGIAAAWTPTEDDDDFLAAMHELFNETTVIDRLFAIYARRFLARPGMVADLEKVRALQVQISRPEAPAPAPKKEKPRSHKRAA